MGDKGISLLVLSDSAATNVIFSILSSDTPISSEALIDEMFFIVSPAATTGLQQLSGASDATSSSAYS